MDATSLRILTLLAQGYTVDEILMYRSDWSYRDIRHAAESALQGMEQSSLKLRAEQVKSRYGNAYGKWSWEEELTLLKGYRAGLSVSQLARQLQRQPGAIRFRLERLGLASVSTHASAEAEIRYKAGVGRTSGG